MDFKKIINSNESRINFIKGLIHLAKADGVILPEEQQYFIGAAYTLELSENDICELLKTIESNEPVIFNFESMQQKLLFIREAIQLCCIDNDYDENEQKEIYKIAKEFNIPQEHIKKIEQWVFDGIEWKNKGDEFLSL